MGGNQFQRHAIAAPKPRYERQLSVRELKVGLAQVLGISVTLVTLIPNILKRHTLITGLVKLANILQHYLTDGFNTIYNILSVLVMQKN